MIAVMIMLLVLMPMDLTLVLVNQDLQEMDSIAQVGLPIFLYFVILTIVTFLSSYQHLKLKVFRKSLILHRAIRGFESDTEWRRI